MDPDSGSQAMTKAAERGQGIVGWYHSHPTFEVSPSNIDVNNHKAYHNMFVKDNKPFIGFIIGPYHKEIDVKRGYNHSLQKCFHLKSASEYMR
jgi:histone H2A deubiquitinase